MRIGFDSQPPRILLVIESDDDGRVALGTLLGHFGFLCVVARDGGEALDELLSEGLRPCAIFLELIAPSGGSDFRVRQLAEPAWADIPVLLGTAAAPGDVHADRRVLHPLDPYELLAMIDRVCPIDAGDLATVRP